MIVVATVRCLPPAQALAGWARLALGLLALALAACDQAASPASERGADASDTAVEPPADEPPLFDANRRFARPALCDRPKRDAVREIFCSETPQPVRSLRQLSARLALIALPDASDDAQAEALANDPHEFVETAVYMGHSTALAGQLVSPINPRAIVMGRETILAFQRGVQQVELITTDRDDGELNFYLVSFAQACNDERGGCKPGDLFTQRVERDWLDLVLRDDEELKNTPLDCRQCHRRAIEHPVLLMRELRGPWTHFFAADADEHEYAPGDDGRELTREFRKAKRGEAYAGLPAFLPRHTGGVTLQNRVTSAQPLNFESAEILIELSESESAGRPRRSATWDAIYAAFKRGERLAPPYFEARATDPAKQAALTVAYHRYLDGEIEAEALPDLSDIFPDDPQVRAEIGLQTEPGADGPALLIQACGACHNDVLDQTISRARFNIALARMDRAELDLAIARIQLPHGAGRAMPPAENRQLDAAGRARLIAYLKRAARPAADDAALEHAAQVGMAFDPRNMLGL